MADPTLVERVEQALAKAEWPAQVIFVQKIEREEQADPPHQCLTHPEERHVAFDIQMSRTTRFEQREHVVEWDVEGYMVNLFCANCTPEQAEVIANIRPWLSGLVAEVRRLEAAANAALQRGREQGAMLAWLQAEIDGIHIEGREYDLNMEADEAARALIATTPNLLAAWERDALPVPPAPSTAHDGKEGA